MLSLKFGKGFVAAMPRVDVQNPDAGRHAGADGEVVLDSAAEPAADRRRVCASGIEAAAHRGLLRSINAGKYAVAFGSKADGSIESCTHLPPSSLRRSWAAVSASASVQPFSTVIRRNLTASRDRSVRLSLSTPAADGMAAN